MAESHGQNGESPQSIQGINTVPELTVGVWCDVIAAVNEGVVMTGRLVPFIVEIKLNF